MTEENKHCPFCGGEVDPSGWMSLAADSSDRKDAETGPECNDCGATAPSLDVWNRRVASKEKPVAWRFRFKERGASWTLTSTEMKPSSYAHFDIEPLVVQKNV